MKKPLNPWKLPDFRAGQNVMCRIERREPDGYAVTISKDNLPGFLPTEERLKIGEEVLAQFVCISNNRILLTTRFSNMKPGAQTIPSVRWEDELRQINSHDQTNSPNMTEEEAAFRVWAKQVDQKHIHLTRATDLILAPLKQTDVQTFSIAEHDLEWLITDLEGGMQTCCVKTSSQNVRSRSAMLLYKGRCVGCIYSSKNMPECPEQEEALQNTLSDLRLPETKVTLYHLPENLVIASSALFFGYPVERQENISSHAYFDYTMNWLEEKKYTACITFSFTKHFGHCFIYVYRGQYAGTFYVEDQSFHQERSYVDAIFANDPDVTINVQILPTEMTSGVIRFGFSLSMACQKRD